MDFLRNLIPATSDVIYMNTGWAGPSPVPVVERVHATLVKESACGPASLEGIQLAKAANEEGRLAVASLLSADPDEILLTHGTSEGVNAVLYGLPWKAGDGLVTCTLEHPALATPATVLEERQGVTVKRVELAPTASEDEMVEQFSAAIDQSTRLVALSHVQFSCGLRLPVAAIVRLARQAGALVLIDGAQSGGAISLDVHELGVDFYAISGQKWLLGPKATGALYVHRDRRRLFEPLFTTHGLADNRALQPESADANEPLHRFQLAAGSPALFAGFAEAVKLLTGIGLQSIEAESMALAQRLRGGIRSIPGAVLTGPASGSASSALVSVALDGWLPRQLVEQLWNRWRISVRAAAPPAAVRFSLAAFNTESEVDKALEALSELAKQRPIP